MTAEQREQIEYSIKQYEEALTQAADYHFQIKELLLSQNDDLNEKVMTRLTDAAFKFRNSIDQHQ
ncbi:MAG: hypothetical protein ABJB85_12260 [Nitrososphaerota archaeon]